jgi:hypothetical protein
MHNFIIPIECSDFLHVEHTHAVIKISAGQPVLYLLDEIVNTLLFCFFNKSLLIFLLDTRPILFSINNVSARFMLIPSTVLRRFSALIVASFLGIFFSNTNAKFVTGLRASHKK